MADITFIVHSDWLKNIETLPREDQDKIIADFVRYGTERQTEYDDNPYVFSQVNQLKGLIDNSKKKYEEAVKMGQSVGGRKKKLNEDAIIELLQQGYTKSQEIAEILGCSKSAIDHSDAWRNRKKY